MHHFDYFYHHIENTSHFFTIASLIPLSISAVLPPSGHLSVRWCVSFGATWRTPLDAVSLQFLFLLSNSSNRDHAKTTKLGFYSLIYSLLITLSVIRGCEVSDCGKVLLLSISKGCEPVNKYWVHDLPDQGLPDQFNFTKIVDNFDAEYDVSFLDGFTLFFCGTSSVLSFRKRERFV